jgi:hypothetical protein
MASINPNYMGMSNYGSQYQPLPPLALTQPAPVTDWSSPYVPQTRSFAVGAPAQPNLVTAVPPMNANAGAGNGAWLGSYGDMAPAPVINTAGQRSIFDSFLQNRDASGVTSGGWGQAGLGILQGVGGLYLGMQQYNLAKDALATSKEQFNRQFEVNKNLTNSRLEDRQRARVASNAGAYQSVGDYMNQNGVK